MFLFYKNQVHIAAVVNADFAYDLRLGDLEIILVGNTKPKGHHKSLLSLKKLFLSLHVHLTYKDTFEILRGGLKNIITLLLFCH